MPKVALFLCLVLLISAFVRGDTSTAPSTQAATQPAAAPLPVDEARMAKAPVVLRVLWKGISPPGGNPSDTVQVLKVLKNESTVQWGLVARIDHEPGQKGVPRGQECTVYLEVSATLKGRPWALAGGGAATGVSHVGMVAAVSSKAVIKDGLSVVVSLPKATFAADEPVQFTVQFRNVSDKRFTLFDAEWFWNWTVQFTALPNSPWQLHKTFTVKQRNAKDNPLAADEELDVPVTLDSGQEGLFNFVWDGKQSKEVPDITRLKPGKYRLAITLLLDKNPTQEKPQNYWTGKITTEPVEFEIADKPAGAATNP